MMKVAVIIGSSTFRNCEESKARDIVRAHVNELLAEGFPQPISSVCEKTLSSRGSG